MLLYNGSDVVEHHDNDESRRRTETEDDDQRAIDDLFEGGKVVYKSPVATHDLEPLEISFVPKPAKSSDKKPPMYHLWFVVGGGGGHSLTIENVYVHTLVLDDADRTMSKAYASLARFRIHPKGNEDEEDDCDSEDTDSVFFDHVVVGRENRIFCAKNLRCLAETLLQAKL
ncbi:MAG: hypothetical protein SGARI_002481 [Bacillariaceae sp.]